MIFEFDSYPFHESIGINWLAMYGKIIRRQEKHRLILRVRITGFFKEVVA